MMSADEPENMKQRRRVTETHPAWRKMISIQTQEDHSFNMDKTWKKVSAACLSVCPSQQNMIVVKLLHPEAKFPAESLTLNKEPQGGQQ